MAAGFKRTGCNPANDPLRDPFTVWDDRYIGMCIPTGEINNMAFWCDGFDGIDMSKARKMKRGNLGVDFGTGTWTCRVSGVCMGYCCCVIY